MRECSQAASHSEGQHDPSTRPKQLRDREVSWEGSHRSKLMSRRTERPYKVDGAGELARHSAARCSAMRAVRLQESAEAIVPRATSRGTLRKVSQLGKG